MKSFLILVFSLTLIFNCSISRSFGRSSDSMGRSSDSIGRSSDSMGRSSDSSSESSKTSAGYMGKSSDVMSNSSRGFSMSIVYSFLSSKDDKNKEKKTTYRMDVRGIAELYSKNISKDKGFIRDLTFVAEKNGITNWNSEKLTYFAIGEGLSKSSLSQKEFQDLKKELSNGRPEIQSLIEKGYHFDSNSSKNVDLDS